jgi:DNA-binding XRE family transcriptional regulator
MDWVWTTLPDLSLPPDMLSDVAEHDGARPLLASHPNVHRVIGRLLGDARQAAGLPQSAAAARVGVSQSWLARLETGERRLTIAEAAVFATLYDVPLEAFDPRKAPPGWFHEGPRRRPRTPSIRRNGS